MDYNNYLNNQKYGLNQEIDINQPKHQINKTNGLEAIKIKLKQLEDCLYDERNKNVSKVSEIIDLINKYNKGLTPY